MAEEAWELQKPPSLARQNRSLAGLELLDAVSHSEKHVDTFIRDFEGNLATCPTRVSCRIDKDHIRLRFECAEDRMADVSFAAEEPPDPDAELLWSGDLQAIQETAHWRGGRDDFLEWIRQTGDRPRSVFTDDCVMITLCAVAVGDDPSHLAVVRQVRNPLPLLSSPPARQHEPRVYLEGSYYYIAVALDGRTASAFYDPWDGGVYWPCWHSGAEAEVSRGENGWAADLTVPLTNLEPLVVRDSVWGIDFYRRRPARGDEPAEWARSAESIFFRQTDNHLGERRFLTTPEEIGRKSPRHAYIPSELPFIDSIVARKIPSVDIRSTQDAAGELCDDIWADAQTIQDFWLDQTGAEPTARTEVRITYDRKFLYVRFDCFDDDTKNLRVVTKEQELAKYGEGSRRANYLDRREAWGLDWGDYVEVMLVPGLEGADVYHGGYYDILVNSQGDVLRRYWDPYGAFALCEDELWKPDLRVRVNVGDDRWQVFLAIPFAALHGMDRAKDTWRCNFKRARGARDVPSPEDDVPQLLHQVRLAFDPMPEGSEISAWSPEYGRCRLLERLGFLNFKGMVEPGETIPEDAGPAIIRGGADEEPDRSPSASAARDCLSGVHFPTPESGWAVGGLGTILHTEDAGATWRVQRSNTDHALAKVFFLDELRGFAVGGRHREQHLAIQGNQGVILATRDGGESWRRVFSGEGAYLCDVCFVGDRVGYAVGEYGVVLKTTDGGEHWRHLANTGTKHWLLTVHFVDENHGWAAGESGTTIATEDGGESWRRCNAPTTTAPFGFPAEIRSICFLDRRQGWAAGDRGTFLRTDDGGRTWRRQELGLPPQVADVVHFNAVRFFDRQQGLAVAEPGTALYRTQDGGRTWRREEGPAETAFYDVCFDPRGDAWAVGELGRIARRSGGQWLLVSGRRTKPPLLFGTPHAHHVSSTPWPAITDEYDVFTVVAARGVKLDFDAVEANRRMAAIGCMELGMRGIRTILDMPGGRRREPHRIHHLYQLWHGIEPTERRLVATIRSLRPRTLIAEWPIMQEGYWAADVGLFARALIRAFDSAADPERFPELEQIGLAPWRVERLYNKRLHQLSDMCRINHRKDWTVRTKGTDFSQTLGTSIGEANYRGRCSWAGLLDRNLVRSVTPWLDAVFEQFFQLTKQR